MAKGENSEQSQSVEERRKDSPRRKQKETQLGRQNGEGNFTILLHSRNGKKKWNEDGARLIPTLLSVLHIENPSHPLSHTSPGQKVKLTHDA